MEVQFQEAILAVVVKKEDREKAGGGVPLFVTENEEEKIRVAQTLASVLKAMVHDLGNGVFILVKH